MNVKVITVATLATLACGAASAAGYHNNSNYVDSHWYVLGAVGGSYLDSKIYDKAENLAYDEYGSDASPSSTKESIAGKLGAGYQINKYFAVEGALYYLGKQKITAHDTGNAYNSNGRISVQSVALGVDGLAMLPIERGAVFAKAGLAVVRQHFKLAETEYREGVEDGEPVVYESDDSTPSTKYRVAPKLGLGVEFNLTPKMAIRTEYEGFFRVGKNKKTAYDSNGDNYHLLTLGLKYKF